MNEYAIIFWLAFIAVFLTQFLLLKTLTSKLNFFYYISSVIGSFLIYKLIDYLAVSQGPELIGAYASQSVIGMAAGWFVSRNLKNTFRLNKFGFLTGISLLAGWYNYIF